MNFEKLATIAGLKNASSAQTCYNGAKRKFLNGAAVTTNASSLATGSTATPKSAPSAPASKKRKTSAKTTTSNPTKGKNSKGSSNTAKNHSVTNNDDNAFDADNDADNDADDDEEPGHELDLQNVLAYVSDEAAANAADMQLKLDADAHAGKHIAGLTPDNGYHHALPATIARDNQAKAEEVEMATVVKAEAEAEADEKGKARNLLRKAIQKAMITSLGNGNEASAVAKGDDFVSFGTVVDLPREGGGEEVLGTRTTASARAKTGGGLVGGGEVVGNADVV